MKICHFWQNYKNCIKILKQLKKLHPDDFNSDSILGISPVPPKGMFFSAYGMPTCFKMTYWSEYI